MVMIKYSELGMNKVSSLVERLRQSALEQEVLSSFPAGVKKNSVCSTDVVGKPNKQLGTETYYYVIINAPMRCLSLNRLQSLMVGHKTSIRTKK